MIYSIIVSLHSDVHKRLVRIQRGVDKHPVIRQLSEITNHYTEQSALRTS